VHAFLLQISDMAFWSIDSKSQEPLRDFNNATTRDMTDAVCCGCSISFSTPRTTHDDQGPAPTKSDDSVPSPDTPLRERRLPASFWQEPNVPRRTVRTSPWRSTRRADAVGRISSAATSHRQPSSLDFRPSQPAAALMHRRQLPCPPDLAGFSTWRGTDGHAFLRDSAFNFDVPTKPPPPPPTPSTAVDLVRQFAHLSPWPVAGLPGLYPGHGGSLAAATSPSEELAASAAVVAAYLRWRAVEEDCKPIVECLSGPPSALDWPSMAWQPCSTGAAASVAIQRLHRYHPY